MPIFGLEMSLLRWMTLYWNGNAKNRALRYVFEATLLVTYSLDILCGLATLFAATTSEVMSAKHSSAPSPSASASPSPPPLD